MSATKKRVIKARPPVVNIHDSQGFNSTLPRWNLICDRGHLHYSPEPMAFVDRECTIRYVNANKKKVTCRRKMVLLKDYKPGPLSISKSKIKPKDAKKKPVKKRRIIARY